MDRILRVACSLSLVLSAALTGCAWLAASDGGGPDEVDPDVRLPLRLSVVGLHGASMLLLYGGPAHDVFLGCYTCERTDQNSVFNPDGPYGSTHNERSIWNRQGPYGGRTSDFSPWNPHAVHPPLILDENDRAHGFFSANSAIADRTRDPATIRFIKIESERQ